MTATDTIQFRKLARKELDILVSWAEQEGWNPGIHDADVFWATDPDGFVGCFNGDELVGGGSIVSYNGDFGFMGFFIVKPGYRASGIGRQLWYKRRDTLLARLKPGAAIGMDGVVAMQPFYSKGGFHIAFRDERHERVGAIFEVSNNISSIIAGDIETVVSYDAQCFGCSRPQFLKLWLVQEGTRTFKFTEQGEFKGFAVLRKAQKGYKIGPLFADSATVAEEIYKSCLSAVPGEPVFIDIPVANTGAVTLMQQYNTTYVFECARMYYGNPPAQTIDKVYGITSFELG
ncbi:MAG: N-acetyltransferase, family [Flavipsychrobacter sp.]|jgi:GNAT superfamily N-acetyltransferase|nr:N-acetyltransferase, family [Flavipsychrobacter sp.]